MSSNKDWDAWLEENPLKKWMTANDITQAQVGGQFGRSTFAVYSWLRGIIPDTTNSEWFFDGMRDMTGIEDFEEQWRAWERKRPMLGRTA